MWRPSIIRPWRDRSRGEDALCVERLLPTGPGSGMCMSKWSQAWTLRTWPPPFVPIRCFSATRRWSLPVNSVAALEQGRRGVDLERRERARPARHQRLFIEARFDEAMMTAMNHGGGCAGIAELSPGAHALLDVPLSALWGPGVGRNGPGL